MYHKHTKKQQLRSKADKLWFIKCLKPECEVCGQPAIQSHHFYYKSSYGHLRYNLDNGISLCQSCHFILHHQDPKKIEEMIIERRGQKWYNQIKKESRIKPELSYQTVEYYQRVIKNLE